MKWNSRGSEAKKPIVGEMRLHSRGKEALMSGTRSKNRRGSEAKIDGHVGKGQSDYNHQNVRLKKLRRAIVGYFSIRAQTRPP